MSYVDNCYNKVRKDLEDVGLLVEGYYLDHVEVCVTGRPSAGEAGFLFEHVGSWCRQGYRPGVIYLPSDLRRRRASRAEVWSTRFAMSMRTLGISPTRSSSAKTGCKHIRSHLQQLQSQASEELAATVGAAIELTRLPSDDAELRMDDKAA